MKCVFTCSKDFLVFLESILFLKTENFKNHFCPVLATQSQVSQVACHNREFAGQFGDLLASGRSSREGYTEIFVAQLATPSLVDLPVVKNT